DAVDRRSPSEIWAEKTIAEVPRGPEIFGVFQGRTPCQELSELLKVPSNDICNKIKCRLILYQNPKSKEPTTFSWKGKVESTAKWSVANDGAGKVFKLEMEKGVLSLLKVDENVLYFLNTEGVALVGNWEFSYTMNRIIPDKPAK